MFERFTDRARRVVVLAQEEARLLDHAQIGTEHLLLGLAREGEGMAARVLQGLGVSLDRLREEVEKRAGRGPGTPERVPFTPRAKKVLELSLREALQLGHNYIGTEHILLGLVREADGLAAQTLGEFGVDLYAVRERTIQLLGEFATPAPATRAPEEPGPTQPACPACQGILEGRLGTRVLVATRDEAGGPDSVLIVYCRACGRSIGAFGAG